MDGDWMWDNKNVRENLFFFLLIKEVAAGQKKALQKSA